MKRIKEFKMDKKKVINRVKRTVSKMVCCAMFSMLIGIDSFATSSNTVEASLSGFQDILESFVTSVGSMITLWGIFEWGNSMQSNDGMQQSAAFKRIGGGLIMCIAPNVLTSIV